MSFGWSDHKWTSLNVIEMATKTDWDPITWTCCICKPPPCLLHTPKSGCGASNSIFRLVILIALTVVHAENLLFHWGARQYLTTTNGGELWYQDILKTKGCDNHWWSVRRLWTLTCSFLAHIHIKMTQTVEMCTTKCILSDFRKAVGNLLQKVSSQSVHTSTLHRSLVVPLVQQTRTLQPW